MKFTPELLEERKRRIIAVARELVRETGDFDVPMRELAARAQVSLRIPYELFGSKTGLIGAVLAEDQKAFRDSASQFHSSDELENIFDRVRMGMEFFANNQPFYRALYRATQAYTPGHDEEPARESLGSWRRLCQRASRAGLIRPEVDPLYLGETLTDIFASNVRTWARDSSDIQLTGLKISFGFAAVLAGGATEPGATRMRSHVVEFQHAIEDFGATSQGAEAPASTRRQR